MIELEQYKVELQALSEQLQEMGDSCSGRHGGQERDHELRPAVEAVPRRLVGVRLQTQPPAAPPRALCDAARRPLQHLLPVGQRAEGQ